MKREITVVVLLDLVLIAGPFASALAGWWTPFEGAWEPVDVFDERNQ